MGFSDKSLAYEPREGKTGRPRKLVVNGKQQCSICREWKDLLQDFGRNKIMSSGRESRCKKCNTARGQAWRQSSVRQGLACVFRAHKITKGFRRSPRRAELVEKSCVTMATLMVLWARQRGLCAVTGLPLTYVKGSGAGAPTNVSLDRIDSALGYVDGNVRLVCKVVNYMKNVLTDKEMVEWAKAIVNGPVA